MRQTISFKSSAPLATTSRTSRAFAAAPPRDDSKVQGFTLVELLVAATLFSIVIAIAAGGFVNALRTQRSTAAEMAAESNVSLAIEEMARDMRTGYLFCHDVNSANPSTSPVPANSPANCFSACSVNSQTNVWTCNGYINYYNAAGQPVSYYLSPAGVLMRSVDNATSTAVTGDNVDIPYLSFVIFGNTEGDHWNPRITIAIGIQPNDPTVTWDTSNLETTVSAREIDCTQGSPSSC